MPARPIQWEPDGIEKVPTGIDGFDQITRGGLPAGRTTLVMGLPGSGKTIFALQSLVSGARRWGEPGIFVAFEENSHQIFRNAATFGWDLEALQQEKLFFLDARKYPSVEQVGDFDLVGVLASLKAKAGEMGARRIVFDSIDVLLARLDNPHLEREEIYRVHDWLSHHHLTGIVTTRSDGEQMISSERYGFMQYMADCVVVLHRHLVNRVSLRSLHVVKYRGSEFAENEFPMAISSDGIDVAASLFVEPDYPVFTERVSTGVRRLDSMLNGGYLRGTSVLITGAPGTAKSSLAAAFANAACLRGERALYVSYDESADEVIRNMASIGIDLQAHADSGLLRTYTALADSRSAEGHVLVLKNLIEERQPRCMVIDPLSAMLKAGGLLDALGAAQRLIYLAKAAGITLVCTSLLDTSEGDDESSPMKISTIADTWLHLSYLVGAGERNRALTIVKSRGTRHSNQVRELVLSDEGITLADVYTAGGVVLMGTLRYEKEAEELRQQELRRLEAEYRVRDLAQREAKLQAQMEVLKLEIETLHMERENTQRQEESRVDWQERWHTVVGHLRRADASRDADLGDAHDE